MSNKLENNEHFSNDLIDEIEEDQRSNYFTPILHEALKHVSSPRVILDVGCGNGVFSAELKNSQECRLIGVDGNQYALKQAKKRGFDELHLINDFSNDELPFVSDSVDFVICKDVLEHLIHPENLISEIVRVAKNNAYVLLHVPNHFSIIGRLKLLFKNTIDPFSFFPDAERWNFPHIRFYDKNSIVKMCEMYNLNLDLELSWHFVQPSIIKKYTPWIAKNIGTKYTDAMCGGITLLFRIKA